MCFNRDLFFCKIDRISSFFALKRVHYIRSNQFIFAICCFCCTPIEYSEETNIYENVNNCSVLALFFNISIFKIRFSWNFSLLFNLFTTFIIIICLLKFFGGTIIWFDMTDRKRVKLLLKLSVIILYPYLTIYFFMKSELVETIYVYITRFRGCDLFLPWPLCRNWTLRWRTYVWY